MSVARRTLQQDAPVLRLPNELLLDVFTRVRDAWCQWDSSENWKPESAPYMNDITAVCKQWQDIAIADPLLWGKIAIFSKWGRNPTSVSALEASLQRSRNVALDIHISYYDLLELSVFMPFKQHVQRCRSLTLEFSTFLLDDTRGRSMKLPGPLTNLSHLHIGAMMVSLPQSPLVEPTLPCPSILGDHNMAPLEHLNLDFGHVKAGSVIFSGGFVHLRTERLRSLTIKCGQPEWYQDLMGLVSRCENVEDMYLWLEVPRWPAHMEPFALNKLERLENCSSSPFFILGMIMMPALSELRIDGGCAGSGESMFTMPENHVGFPHITLPSLCTLGLDFFRFEEDDTLPLSSFFRANPTIETIRATTCERHSILMSAMLHLNGDKFAAIAEPLAKSEVVALPDESQDPRNMIMPHLKVLQFTRQQDCMEPKDDTNLASLFTAILSQWESIHIEVDDWQDGRGIPELDISDETRDMRMLTDLYEGRFKIIDIPASPYVERAMSYGTCASP